MFYEPRWTPIGIRVQWIKRFPRTHKLRLLCNFSVVFQRRFSDFAKCKRSSIAQIWIKIGASLHSKIITFGYCGVSTSETCAKFKWSKWVCRFFPFANTLGSGAKKSWHNFNAIIIIIVRSIKCMRPTNVFSVGWRFGVVWNMKVKVILAF